tara:strand:- start:4187 stop:5083 length:897 start_codon:yes stop_codon:yes gene_type:complete
LKTIPSELLRTFVTINELGGFTAAGERLGRSQPAISLQMKKLEEMLGTRLFLRGSQLEMTQDGDYLYQEARAMLAINDRLVEKLCGGGVSGKVRLGIPNDFELAFVPRVLRNLARVYPNIEVEVDCEISRVILQRFHRHHYDIALVMEPERVDDDRDARDIRVDDLVWVVGDTALLEGEAPLPLVTYPLGCLYRSAAEAALRARAMPYRVSYASTSLLGIFTAVEEGLGVTALARSVSPDHLHCVDGADRLPELGRVTFGLHYQTGELSVAAHHVLNYLRAGLADMGGERPPMSRPGR